MYPLEQLLIPCVISTSKLIHIKEKITVISNIIKLFLDQFSIYLIFYLNFALLLPKLQLPILENLIFSLI